MRSLSVLGTCIAFLSLPLACKRPSTGQTNTSARASATAPASSTASSTSPASSTSANFPPDPRLHVAVDRRVEVLSVLFALAGNAEYQHDVGTPYVKAVNETFLSFRDHPAVVKSKELHEKHHIGFDAPIALAVQLDDKLQAAQPFDPLPNGLDDRWKGVNIDDYLADVRDFVDKSHFDDFWNREAPYLDKVNGAFSAYLADKGLLPWFDENLWKKDKATYAVAPAMLSGQNNWGVHAFRPDGTEVVLQAMSLIKADADGIPQLGDGTLWLLAHELSHPYVNPIVDAHLTELQELLERAYHSAESDMNRLHYTTGTIVGYESLARSMQILYVGDRQGKEAAKKNLDEQVKLGFLWMPKLVGALGEARSKGGGHLTEESIVSAFKTVLTAYDANVH